MKTTYDTDALMRVSGLGLRKIQRAMDYGCLVPEARGGGRGNKTSWGASEIALAAIYAGLTRGGFRPSALRSILSDLRNGFDLHCRGPRFVARLGESVSVSIDVALCRRQTENALRT